MEFLLMVEVDVCYMVVFFLKILQLPRKCSVEGSVWNYKIKAERMEWNITVEPHSIKREENINLGRKSKRKQTNGEKETLTR